MAVIELFDCGAQAEVALGGLGIRTFQLPTVGDCVEAHRHYFAHVMFIAAGTVRVWLGEESRILSAGVFVLVEADMAHRVEALSDGVKGWCVFPTYDASGSRGPDFMADRSL